MRTWSNPVPLKEYLARIDARLDASDPEAGKFRAFIIGLCQGFRCEKHPDEGPCIEYKHDHSHFRSVCAPCRALS
jgi:hypothetical protein